MPSLVTNIWKLIAGLLATLVNELGIDPVLLQNIEGVPEWVNLIINLAIVGVAIYFAPPNKKIE